MTPPKYAPPTIDMTKVAAAVANLHNPAADRIRRANLHNPAADRIRRANAYHDLPPVDAHRRRQLSTLHTDTCTGFHNPDFLH
jgi:hypothetical protein